MLDKCQNAVVISWKGQLSLPNICACSLQAYKIKTKTISAKQKGGRTEHACQQVSSSKEGDRV